MMRGNSDCCWRVHASRKSLNNLNSFVLIEETSFSTNLITFPLVRRFSVCRGFLKQLASTGFFSPVCAKIMKHRTQLKPQGKQFVDNWPLLQIHHRMLP